MRTATSLPMDIALEPGSFRDRSSRVFYLDGVPCRGLTSRARDAWRALAATDFYRRFSEGGRIVTTEEIEPAHLPAVAFEEDWVAVLRHEAVPFVSYPYEWCFGMLRDAALLHLELLEAALAEGMTLKDATAYNVQWRGARPVFIDIPSFVRHAAGGPWLAYRQFCQLFLYPLLLHAYRGVPFQPLLRGRLDGIPPEDCARLLSWRDWLRPGVLGHVVLQARFQERLAGTRRDVRAELRAVGFDKRLILANVAGLKKLIRRLRPKVGRWEWAGYEDGGPYREAEQRQKEAFVYGVLASRPWGLVWDLGCHTGRYARLAADHARTVVAMDRDAVAVERLYGRLKEEGNDTVLPLVCDLADPSPDQGWRGLERKSLAGRGRPDLTLCLALLHHAVIGANLPLREVIGWLANLGGDLVIEFVTRDDPMVWGLLRNRDDQYADYDLGHFERCLARSYSVARREVLGGGTRVLYYARAKR